MAMLNKAFSLSQPEKRIKKARPQLARSQRHIQQYPHVDNDVLENIFSFLPITNAVQMSTLSTRFQESWLFNRKLLFGVDFYLRYSKIDLSALIDRVFNLHKGSKIQSFDLYIDPSDIENLIEKWVRICKKKKIEELYIEFDQPIVTVGSDFLDDIETLRILKLANCELQLPHTLKGLSFLRTLILRQIDLGHKQLENLLRHCKMLETLDLANCRGIRQVNIFARNHKHFKTFKISCCHEVQRIQIDAPTLRSIFYNGSPIKVQFAQGLQLDDAFMNFVSERNYLQAFKLENLINDLSHLKVFTTTAMFLEFLVQALKAKNRAGVFGEMLFCFHNLKELQLFMEKASFCDPYDIAMFLKGCPLLEKLFIDLTNCNLGCGLYWLLHQKPLFEKLNHFLPHLNYVKLQGFRLQTYQLELVRMLLKKAKSLETLVFVTPRNGKIKLASPEAMILHRELSECPKASKNLKVYLFEQFKDKSGVSPTHEIFWDDN